MCGRATLSNHDLNDVLRELDAEFAAEDASLFRPRYNIAPSDTHWIVEAKGDRRVLVPAVWGYLPSTSASPSASASASRRSSINVRGEQVASRSGFRQAFDERRCVLVTDGFFEWDQRRMPHWYHRPDGGLVLLAGLFQGPGALPAEGRGHATAQERTGAPFPRFTVLTTRPNQLVARVHNRMPVIIPQDRLDLWLTAEPAAASRLIAPAPEEALIATAVSRRVNSVKNDDPGCLTPAAATAAAPPRQGSLF